MRINGWEKISGFTYKGLCIVNPIHNADETKYMADVVNLNLPQKPKWELVVLTPAHEFRAVNDDRFHIMLWDEDKFSSRYEMDKAMIASISNFRMIFERLVDEILEIQIQLAPISHSIHVNANNSGTTINYGTSILPTFDDFVNMRIKTPMVQFTQTLIKK